LFFNEFTGIKFPFNKCDQIFCPEKTGAMENVGAITYGESLLTNDDATIIEKTGY